MQIRIYQPDLEANSSHYILVYAADVNCDDVDELCSIFGHSTTDPRRGSFRGCPLQNNDIVEVIHDDSIERFKFVESDWADGDLELIGELSNDGETIHYDEDAVTGVLAEPGKAARITRLSLDRNTLVKLFGLNNQVVSLPGGVSVICCEWAFNDPEHAPDANRILIKEGGREPVAAVAGPVFFCAVNINHASGKYFISSLNRQQCMQLIYEYELPEKFYVLNGKLMSLKFFPSLTENAAGEEIHG